MDVKGRIAMVLVNLGGLKRRVLDLSQNAFGHGGFNLKLMLPVRFPEWRWHRRVFDPHPPLTIVVGAAADHDLLPSGSKRPMASKGRSTDPNLAFSTLSTAAGSGLADSAPIRPLLGARHLLGYEWIDRDLQAIADGWLRVVTCERLEFPFFIARMKKLMRTHFDHEAQLMSSVGGTLCECHQYEHRTMIDLCDQAASYGAENWRRTQSLLRCRFPKLVRDHVVGMDQIAVLFINANTVAHA